MNVCLSGNKLNWIGNWLDDLSICQAQTAGLYVTAVPSFGVFLSAIKLKRRPSFIIIAWHVSSWWKRNCVNMSPMWFYVQILINYCLYTAYCGTRIGLLISVPLKSYILLFLFLTVGSIFTAPLCLVVTRRICIWTHRVSFLPRKPSVMEPFALVGHNAGSLHFLSTNDLGRFRHCFRR